LETGITQSTFRFDFSDVSGSHMDLNLMLGVQVLIDLTECKVEECHFHSLGH